MPRKKIPTNKKYTKKTAQEVCDYIKQDIPLKEIQKKDPSKYPNPSTVMDWKKNYPEFAKMYQEAREIQATVIMEEYNYLVKNPPAPSGEKVMDSYNLKIWDSQVRALQFKIINLNKRFDPKTFDDVQKVEHKGLEKLQGPQIVIANYATPEKQVNNLIEGQVDEKKDS